ncbi:MAG TPA: histidine kinase [Anaerolineae bacterium]|nr:histidine kinase [Anaerolineae bacterium]
MSSQQGPEDRTIDTRERIAALEKEIEQLNARLPKHSTPPSMIIALEDLEEELAALRAAPAAGMKHERE